MTEATVIARLWDGARIERRIALRSPNAAPSIASSYTPVDIDEATGIMAKGEPENVVWLFRGWAGSALLDPDEFVREFDSNPLPEKNFIERRGKRYIAARFADYTLEKTDA